MLEYKGDVNEKVKQDISKWEKHLFSSIIQQLHVLKP